MLEKEIDKRRQRLNAPKLEELKKEVEREILGTSKAIFFNGSAVSVLIQVDLQLPQLYNDILNHQYTPDELRRITESKLLRYKRRYLHALPSFGKLSSTKARIASEVESLTEGVVVLGIPDELAWTIYIDGQDSDSIGQLISFRSTLKY